MLSFLFWKRLRAPLIELGRIGCLNFHPAPLPDMRGMGGFNVAILEGFAEWGVSGHFVDADFDTGDLVRVDRFPVEPAPRRCRWTWTARCGLLALFKDVVDMAVDGTELPRTPQGEGRYVTQGRVRGHAQGSAGRGRGDAGAADQSLLVPALRRRDDRGRREDGQPGRPARCWRRSPRRTRKPAASRSYWVLSWPVTTATVASPATPWLSASMGSRWEIFRRRPTSAASRSAPGA